MGLKTGPQGIFDVGRIDVPSEKTPHVFAQSIVDLTKTVANDNPQVTVSCIVPRNVQWSKKVYDVNKVLLNLCKDGNIPFISHSGIDAKRNLNNSKLHLNIEVLGITGKLCQVFERLFQLR